MRTPVFIGVGGTGQTILAAYLRLCHMAGLDPGSFYVVDSDNRGPMSQTLTELAGSVSANNGTGPGAAVEDRSVSHRQRRAQDLRSVVRQPHWTAPRALRLPVFS